MAQWADIAEWRGSTVNEGDGDGRPGEAADRAVECRGIVIHIADGYYEGTISWQKNPAADVSSHFVIAGPRDVPKGRPDGRIAQVVDTDVRAWTQQAGNGHWISVECSGFSGDALSPAQIESCARIAAKGHLVYGYPLQLAISPAGLGIGHHSMGTNGRRVPTDTWTGPTWGHEECPGPAIVGQKGAILARAIQIINGATPQQEEDDMPPKFVWCSNTLYVVGGGFVHPTKTTSGWAKLFKANGWTWDEAMDKDPAKGVQVTADELASMGRSTATVGAGALPPVYSIELSGATGIATAKA